MKVLVGMSGGVDSSVAAALLIEQGHDVTGVTLKLWGGSTDRGCCSVADVDDARRVAQQLGIRHQVFNFGEDFFEHVVTPYLDEHAAGHTPNPCIECNRHVKFDKLLVRAEQLGFDAVATGHHARVLRSEEAFRLARGMDTAKDQSYVLYMLGQDQLRRCLFPVGEMTKDEVRRRAAALGLRTAAKPDSQDVCFIASTVGRESFLGAHIPLTPGRVVDSRSGEVIGSVPAVELVTIGQRRGLALAGAKQRKYVIDADTRTATVVVGEEADLLSDAVLVRDVVWTTAPMPDGSAVAAQSSAHGAAVDAVWSDGRLSFLRPQRKIAPGQSVVLYDGEVVVGGGIAA